jgi:hypothetical protein
MKRGTYCPALAVCIVKLMKNMIALMVSWLAWLLFCRLSLPLNWLVDCLNLPWIPLTSVCLSSSSSSQWPQCHETQSWTWIRILFHDQLGFRIDQFRWLRRRCIFTYHNYHRY